VSVSSAALLLGRSLVMLEIVGKIRLDWKAPMRMLNGSRFILEVEALQLYTLRTEVGCKKLSK
jgi:hypothetical protein